MARLFILAQAVNQADPGLVGASITNLVGSLGAAGAAVAVTYYFLSFLKDHSEKQSELFEHMKASYADSQKNFQDQLDNVLNRKEAMHHTYQDQVGRITDGQNLLLRDAIQAMKSVEKTLDSSTNMIQGIEKTVSTLQLSLMSIDSMIRRVSDARTITPAGPHSRAEETSS